MAQCKFDKVTLKNAIKEVLKEEKIPNEMKIKQIVTEEITNSYIRIEQEDIKNRNKPLLVKLSHINSKLFYLKILWHVILLFMIVLSSFLFNMLYVTLSYYSKIDNEHIITYILFILLFLIFTVVLLYFSILFYDKAKAHSTKFTSAFSFAIIGLTLTSLNSPVADLLDAFFK